MFNALSKDYKDKLKFGVVFSENTEILGDQDIADLVGGQFPTILLVEPARITKYKGNMAYLDIRRHLFKFLGGGRPSGSSGSTTSATPRPLPPLLELTKDSVTSLCNPELRTLCAVAFIEDSSAEEHVRSVLQELQSIYINEGKFAFTWVNEALYPAFKEAFEASVPPTAEGGVPNLRFVVWHSKKSRFMEYEGAMEVSSIRAFLDRVLGGDMKWISLKEVPSLI